MCQLDKSPRPVPGKGSNSVRCWQDYRGMSILVRLLLLLDIFRIEKIMCNRMINVVTMFKSFEKYNGSMK